MGESLVHNQMCVPYFCLKTYKSYCIKDDGHICNLDCYIKSIHHNMIIKPKTYYRRGHTWAYLSVEIERLLSFRLLKLVVGNCAKTLKYVWSGKMRFGNAKWRLLITIQKLIIDLDINIGQQNWFGLRGCIWSTTI